MSGKTARYAIVALALAAAPSLAPAEDKPQAIEALLNGYRDSGAFNGAALVAENGRVIFKKGFGLADFEWQVENTADTRFRLGSITKGFTATLVLQLVEQGKLSLGTKLSEALPYYRKDTGDRITLHQLLNHTSGIPSYTGLPNFIKDKSRDPYGVRDFVLKFCSGDLEFTPGERFNYNNSGYFLLGAILEHATGKTYEQLSKERLFEPLGMHGSGYDVGRPLLARRARGYERSLAGVRNADYLDMSIPYAAGSLYSTVEDLYLWDQALYADKLLKPASREKMFSPGLDDYGYGWNIRKQRIGPDKAERVMLGHGGGINGFSTLIMRVPEEKHLVVLLNNTGGTNLGAIFEGIADVLYGRTPTPAKAGIASVLYETIQKRGVAAALAEYREIKLKRAGDFDMREPQLNRLGRELINEQKSADAIEVFKLSVEAFPASGNAHEGLAEAYRATGDTPHAIQSYAKALELNPKSRNAADKLAELKKQAPAEDVRPPVAKKEPHTTTLHRQTLVDDYHWLRNKGTPEVEQHLKAELAYAQAFMKPTAELQQKLYDEMLGRIQQTDVSVPYLERGFVYYTLSEEGKQYPIYARKQGGADAREQVLLDLNQLAVGKKFLSVGGMRVSPDGTRLAYTIDETGFRQFTLHTKELAAETLGPEAIARVTSFEWTEDGNTLLYTVEHPQTKRTYQLFRHALGAGQDELMYEEKDERFSVRVSKSRDRQYLFVNCGSHTTSEVRYLIASGKSFEMKLVAPRRQDHEYDVDHRAGSFWIRTNDKGRNFRLVSVDAKDPAPQNWREVVPHRDGVMLGGVDLFQDFYVLLEREAGLPQLRVTEFKNGASHRIEFPDAAYVAFPSTNREYDARLYRFSYQSPVSSSAIYDYNPQTRERKLLKQVAVLGGYDASRYKVDLRRARASDGVLVPYWVLYRKDLKLDGSNPALLYGYGSYGASMSASFNSGLFSLVDRGVVYATAYIRGGGELGKKWHDDGRMFKKRNTFTDFIAVAEHLIASKYTRKERLAINGGSAGGLLMGAVTNMRPELFKVVVSHVPFVDVINTMLDESLPLTVGEFEEWGNPKSVEEYRYIRSYSPYENVEAKAYPTMLVKSSYNDSQVMYWEPAKYVAKLRALKTDANPLVFHINMDPAGHGGQSGRYNRLRETAFDYAFLLWQLGVENVPAGVAGSSDSR